MSAELTPKDNPPEHRRFSAVPFEDEQGLLVVYNPTNQAATEHADWLRKYGQQQWPANGPVQILPTEPTLEGNIELLKSAEQEGPHHLAVLGGDGTHSTALKAVRAAKFNGVTAITREGNACDLAHSLNIGKYKEDPIASLRDGVVGLIRPLDILITNPTGEETLTSAISYAGIGLSGIVSHYFNSAAYRNSTKPIHKLNRYANELKITKNFIEQANSFIIDDHVRQPHEAIEYVILNGGRMAKTRFLPYSRIISNHAAIAEIRGNRKRDFARAVGHLMLGGRTMNLHEDIVITLSSEGSTPLMLQTDGEASEINNRSTVRFRLANDLIPVAQTRLSL